MQAQAAESRRRFAMARPYHSVGALQLEERKRPPATPDNLLRSSSYGASASENRSRHSEATPDSAAFLWSFESYMAYSRSGDFMPFHVFAQKIPLGVGVGCRHEMIPANESLCAEAGHKRRNGTLD